MNINPIIGLTTYARNEEKQFQLPAAYIDALVRAGALPTLLPPVDVDAAPWLERCDGLILTGGGDIDPASYGGASHPTNYMMDRQRDGVELALAREALRRELPLLAICRGIQVLNVALGGTLIPHIPDEVGEEVPHRVPPREPTKHPVDILSDSHLAEILECTACVPVSWHHQAIGRIGAGLKVVAHAPYGIIEAVEMPGKPWLIAVQWHPELSAGEDPIQQRLFDRFVATVNDKMSL